MTLDLGSEDAFTEFPAAIEAGGQQYFLVRTDGEYRLVSRVCPHQGGIVLRADSCFECPQHGWRFDLHSGTCLDVSHARLASVPVSVRGGHLWASVHAGPRDAPTTSTARHSPRGVSDWPSDFGLRVVGHACLEIRGGGFTLLTDPWLSGPAFLGAWIPYPPTNVDVSQLRPNAIWISHEHSDHLHLPTLRHFDRETPVYFPDFPNGRLARTLTAMGFLRVHPMRFGKAYEISDGMRVTCFEPPGLWNDSVLFVETGGVKLLNINDAGVNHRIASLVGPVDILASAFNSASSYPLAWTHLSDETKDTIGERGRLGILRMLHQAVRCYEPRYLLPFAAHFALWHPSHRDYLTRLRRSTIDDVVRAFRHTEVKVLDILPGGAWEPCSNTLDRGPDRTRLYDMDYKLDWVTHAFDEAVFEAHHPAPGVLSREQLEGYLLRLNHVPDIAFCEDVVVRVLATEGFVEGSTAGRHVPLDLSFQIASGRLSVLRRAASAPNLTMEVPLRVLRYLVLEDASWDEAHVGFWCRFTRTPDVFHAGFWRLMQAPYYMRAPELNRVGSPEGIGATSNVAELIERYGESAERILARYGLHCGNCPHAPAESLVLAADRHGVDESMTRRMVKELNVALRDNAQLANA